MAVIDASPDIAELSNISEFSGAVRESSYHTSRASSMTSLYVR